MVPVRKRKSVRPVLQKRKARAAPKPLPRAPPTLQAAAQGRIARARAQYSSPAHAERQGWRVDNWKAAAYNNACIALFQLGPPALKQTAWAALTWTPTETQRRLGMQPPGCLVIDLTKVAAFLKGMELAVAKVRAPCQLGCKHCATSVRRGSFQPAASRLALLEARPERCSPAHIVAAQSCNAVSHCIPSNRPCTLNTRRVQCLRAHCIYLHYISGNPAPCSWPDFNTVVLLPAYMHPRRCAPRPWLARSRLSSCVASPSC